ncbi:MAG: hypothetical protein JST55_14670 [Bacteroidetes bacterium]|nr:hypothetical protein [Bacteroidota bacterium]
MKYHIPDSISPREAEKIYKELLAKHNIKEIPHSIEKLYFTIDGIYQEAAVGKPFPVTQEDVFTIVENSKNYIVYTYNNLAGSSKEELIPKKKAISIEYYN